MPTEITGMKHIVISIDRRSLGDDRWWDEVIQRFADDYMKRVTNQFIATADEKSVPTLTRMVGSCHLLNGCS